MRLQEESTYLTKTYCFVVIVIYTHVCTHDCVWMYTPQTKVLLGFKEKYRRIKRTQIWAVTSYPKGFLTLLTQTNHAFLLKGDVS